MEKQAFLEKVMYYHVMQKDVPEDLAETMKNNEAWMNEHNEAIENLTIGTKVEEALGKPRAKQRLDTIYMFKEFGGFRYIWFR